MAFGDHRQFAPLELKKGPVHQTTPSSFPFLNRNRFAVFLYELAPCSFCTRLRPSSAQADTLRAIKIVMPLPGR